ncbi:MAG: flagellar basal body P-ring biosynthesis protein FlgA [Pseudomonadota bacterium]|jgi:flagellar P-ring protein precursor FlgI
MRLDQRSVKIRFILASLLILLSSEWCLASRLKDIANIRGVRENQLIGYGLVIGLKGTGDAKDEFTKKSFVRMLDKLGLKLENQDLESKNVAAVVVTATLPAFGKAGNTIDVMVNSIGSASSLQGGTLLMTPMRAANEEVYGVAQGPVFIGAEKEAHTTVGRVPNGAMIEKDISSDFNSKKMFRLTLNNPDFTTATRAVLTINKELGGLYASAKDPATIDIIVPPSFEGRGVDFLANIESIEVNPDSQAKVVINEKTGTVVIGDKVKISRVVLSHGSISIKVPSADGKKDKSAAEEKMAIIGGSISVGELVQGLNKLGISPKDLITILQSIKAAGALHGELQIL